MKNKEKELRGWVYDVRILGKLNFLLVRDENGNIEQVRIKKGEVREDIFKLVKKLHQEDVIYVKGRIVKSKEARKGYEIIPKNLELVVKSEKPLPLDPREVTKASLDTQLDWRFMYFRTIQGRSIFKIQSIISNSFREFFVKKNFIEIQPPCIISSASEGGSELFSFSYFEKKAYLAQSPQLYKQMAAISFGKVFCLVPVFRAEKFDQPTHLNEIRSMDIEVAFADDKKVMEILEDCLLYISKKVKKECKEELENLDVEVNIKKPFKKVGYEKVVDKLREYGEKIEYGKDFSKSQERIISDIFGSLVFITDWPLNLRPFYILPKNEKIAKAFDLIFNGIEIVSGGQRINDPKLLEKRIKECNLNPNDFKDYLNSFRYGAPEHSGWGMGLERLTMAILKRSNIREVTFWPRTRTRIRP